ncbi:U-Kazal-Dg21.2-like [Glossina fuscipes fuscipes]
MLAIENFLILTIGFLVLVKAGPFNATVDKPKEPCAPGCPRILDPICAVDDTFKNHKYFHNQCLMDYDSCRSGKAWKPTQMLLCFADVDTALRDGCMRVCTFVYNPVCASDGKNFEIFGNQCVLGIENCLASDKWLTVPGEKCGL